MLDQYQGKKMNWIIKLICMAVFPLLLSACGAGRAAVENANGKIAEYKEKYAPDKRVAIFDIEAGVTNGNLMLSGESDQPEGVDALKSELQAEGITFIDSIKMLPDPALEERTFGVVNLSVANLRTAPGHSEELSTQATLGTPLKVLKKRGGWYLVQTPDDYIAWVDSGGLVTMTKEHFRKWQSAEKLIYLTPFGFSYQQPSINAQTVSDLVSGDILEFSGERGEFFQVMYPDNTIAYIPREDMLPYDEWIAALKPAGTNLVSTSKTLMGIPYLWGGTSFKGVDCSGFTKTVYFLNGIIIPRDASQQVHTGILIDTTKAFDKLLPGDLLFFGQAATDSRPERIVHVGMWIGNNEFIHAAGNVHISSVDSTAENFDAYNYNRYVRTKRLLNQPDEQLVRLIQSGVFYNTD